MQSFFIGRFRWRLFAATAATSAKPSGGLLWPHRPHSGSSQHQHSRHQHTRHQHTRHRGLMWPTFSDEQVCGPGLGQSPRPRAVPILRGHNTLGVEPCTRQPTTFF